MRIYLGCLALVIGTVACGGDGSVPEPTNGLSVVVSTTSGSLEGSHVDDSKDVLVFRGVPFARPPDLGYPTGRPDLRLAGVAVVSVMARNSAGPRRF